MANRTRVVAVGSEKTALSLLRWSIVFVLAAYGGISLSAGISNALKPGQSQDLAPVYMASRLWLRGYDPYLAYTAQQWKEATNASAVPELLLARAYSTQYPPVALVNLAPISHFEWIDAEKLWLGFNLILALYVPCLIRYLWYRQWGLFRSAVFLALWFGGFGLRVGLGNGQHTLFWFACMLTALAALSNKKPELAGIPLAISLHKFQLTAVFVPYLVSKKAYRAMAMMVAVVFLMGLVFLWRLNVAPTQVVSSYIVEMRWWYDLSKAGGLPGVGATHFYPVVAWMFGNSIVAPIIMYSLVLTCLAMLSLESRSHRSARTDLEVASFALLLLWSSYHSSYDTVVLILPIAALVDRGDHFRSIKSRCGFIVLMAMLLCLWYTDASKIYRLVNPVPLNELREVGVYRILSFGYRTALVVASISFMAIQWRLRREYFVSPVAA